jgi:DNA (cytosine-5)-methyltransferase 1
MSGGVRPRALDLFCCAGGASMGLHRAGFDVTGVDISPQPHYPFRFIQADALTYPLDGFDFIWASPPCQAHSQMSVRYVGKGGTRDERPDLIPATRARLDGRLFAIENVNGARRSLKSPIRLTGEMFGLGVHRPRWFETSFYLLAPKAPPKQPNPIAVYGERMDGRRLWTRKDGSELRAPRSIEEPSQAMGIDWMEWRELKEAIPPAYAEYIGRAAIAHIQQARAA